ncbi:MAG: TetR/AcrR family transcriptional regulator [Myxococcota bacterium]|nr:TetR/AcrR family transcriptional regulator [Myxococcota bacterium]
MPLPRFEKLPKEKRRAILAAATHEFAEHGFEGASFNRIIAAAGISKGAMYYYFADKADAYASVIEDVFDQLGEALSDLALPDDAEQFWTWLEEGSTRLNETFGQDEELSKLSRGLYSSVSADPTYRRILARGREHVESILARGQALGAVRDDLPLELLADATLGMIVAVDRWFTDEMETRPMDELLAMGTKVLGMVRDMLERRPR